MLVRSWRVYYPKWNECRALHEAEKSAPHFDIRSAKTKDVFKFNRDYVSDKDESEIGAALLEGLCDESSDLRKLIRESVRNLVGFEYEDATGATREITNIDALLEEADQELALEIYKVVLSGDPNAGN